MIAGHFDQLVFCHGVAKAERGEGGEKGAAGRQPPQPHPDGGGRSGHRQK